MSRRLIDRSMYNEGEKEKAILVGLEIQDAMLSGTRSESERSLDELEELSNTAGVEVVGKVLQRRPSKDPTYYIGKGKLEEIAIARDELDAGVVIFDDELSGTQIRNIENVVGVKVIDRTSLILDIFAQRAISREGKIQVELAQLKYRLPRLTGMGGQLSRLGGGIGTRGPGEKKLESDRRHIRRRIKSLEIELKDVSRRRRLIRESRKRKAVPVAAVVGYTNAGKSTLMNALCGADVFVEDKLFATLDPATRKLELHDGRVVLLTDTVGFIRKLPHELIEAFKSTLEEAVQADILIHVVDISDEEADTQISVANDILRKLNALDKPVILVLNKMDLRNSFERPAILDAMDDMICEISATTGKGLDNLIKMIERALYVDEKEIELFIPYSQGWVTRYIHENARLLESAYEETGTRVRAVVRNTMIERIKEFVV